MEEFVTLNMANTVGSCRLFLSLLVIVFGGIGSAVAGDDDDVPYMTQFSSDVNQLDDTSPLHGSKFEYLHLDWIRQRRTSNGRTVTVKVGALDDPVPQVTWLLNGQVVQDGDPQFPQRTRYGMALLTSITIPDVTEVTSLQLLLFLNSIETLTDIQLQDLSMGHSIVEHGTDVALALSSQENVTFNPDTDLVIFARFFAEDLSEGIYQGLNVSFLRMPLAGAAGEDDMEVLTPESNPDVMSLTYPSREEVPVELQHRFVSALRNHTIVRIGGQDSSVRGIVKFTAQYENNLPCRLFGGQRVVRRVFLHPSSI